MTLGTSDPVQARIELRFIMWLSLNDINKVEQLVHVQYMVHVCMGRDDITSGIGGNLCIEEIVLIYCKCYVF